MNFEIENSEYTSDFDPNSLHADEKDVPGNFIEEITPYNFPYFKLYRSINGNNFYFWKVPKKDCEKYWILWRKYIRTLVKNLRMNYRKQTVRNIMEFTEVDPRWVDNNNPVCKEIRGILIGMMNREDSSRMDQNRCRKYLERFGLVKFCLSSQVYRRVNKTTMCDQECTNNSRYCNQHNYVRDRLFKVLKDTDVEIVRSDPLGLIVDYAM